jgi:hypothetical protein
MHLVGFTIEIYYDAWPYERQICKYVVIFSDQSKRVTLLCYVMLLKCLLLNAYILKSVGFCYHYTSSFAVPAYSAIQHVFLTV